MVPAIVALAMLASTQQASAANVCSSSLVHILFDDGTSTCNSSTTGSLAPATTQFSKGTPELSGEASMAMGTGSFGGLAEIGGNKLLPNSTTFFSKAEGSSYDAITPSGGTGAGTPYALVVPFHVTGSYRTTFVGPVNVNFPLPQVVDRFSFTCGGFIGSSGGDCGHGQIVSTDPATFVGQPVDQIYTLNIPLAIGQRTDLFMDFIILAQMTLPTDIGQILCNPSTDIGCFNGGSAIFDMLHTGIFEQAKILNTSGQQVFDVTLNDESGFDYLAPLSGPAPTVPEPSTWLLLGSGLAGLAVWRRKKAA